MLVVVVVVGGWRGKMAAWLETTMILPVLQRRSSLGVLEDDDRTMKVGSGIFFSSVARTRISSSQNSAWLSENTHGIEDGVLVQILSHTHRVP